MRRRILIYSLFVLLGFGSFAQRYNQKIFDSVSTLSDIQYGFNFNCNGDSTKLFLDLYQPIGDTVSSRPLVILAFGGAFLTGNKKAADMVTLCTELAKRGFVCASIQYRIGVSTSRGNTVEKEFAQAVYRGTQDGRAAIRFFRKNIANGNSYKMDGSNIFIGGVSAGGVLGLHLAFLDTYSELASLPIDTALLGTLEGKSGNPGYSSQVKGVISLCGAIGNVSWMHNNLNVSLCNMHGTEDKTVPYKSDYFKIFGANVAFLQGGFSVDSAANKKGMDTRLYSFMGADHVPFDNSILYMDTTIKYISNYLYKQVTGLAPAAVAETNYASFNFSIYPNPAKASIKINFDNPSNHSVSISVIDMTGRLIIQTKPDGNSTDLNTENYSPGIYFIRLINGQQTATQRFLIE